MVLYKKEMCIGETIFKSIPNDIRPMWGKIILSQFDSYLDYIPASVKELYQVIDDKNSWEKAYKLFNKVRIYNLSLTQTNSTEALREYINLAELVTKITFNSSNGTCKFDPTAGFMIPSSARNLAHLLGPNGWKTNELEKETKSNILIYNRHRKFRKELKSGEDLIIYKKIDDVLWWFWDPLRINKGNRRDSYKDYIPEIFRIVKTGASKLELENRLAQIQSRSFGDSQNKKLSDVADAIIN